MFVLTGAGCDARSADTASGMEGSDRSGSDNAGSGNGAANPTGFAGSAGSTSAEPTSGRVNAAQGGTRLKAVVAEAESGTTELLGWYDTELDVRCEFSQLPSGAIACLPSYLDYGWISDAPSALYGDGNCTTEVREISALSFDPCVTPKFAQMVVSNPSADPCLLAPTFMRIGEEARHVFQKVGDTCQTVSKPEGSGEFHAVTPFELDQFVVGTLREGAAAEGIRPLYVTTPDGAEGFWAFHDVEHAFDCQLLTLDDGLHCAPSNAPSITGINFADMDCTASAAMALTCRESDADAVPFVIEPPPYDTPDAGWTVFEGGVRLDDSYSGVTGGECNPMYESLGIFAVGAKIPSARFAAGSLEEVTDARGLVTAIDHAGGWSAPSWRPVHSTHFEGHDCTYLPTSDGVVRCVPSPQFGRVEFADAACTEGLTGDWDSTPVVAFTDDQCPRQAHVYERGEEYAGPVYRKDGEQCVFDRDQAPQPSRYIAHRLGDEVPPENFPAMPISLR
jgi:hypothetical protein